MPGIIRYIAIIPLLFSLISPNISQDTLKIGAYVTSVYDINLSDKSFAADFWLWFNYQNDSLQPLETIEIVNAKTVNFSLHDTDVIDGVNWATVKCKAVLRKEWNIREFPFDEQEMKIEIEESDQNISNLVYLVDAENTKFDKSINLSGWQIIDFAAKSGTHRYETTYGDPSLSGHSEYAQFNLKFIVKRESRGLFLTLFTGVYVSFFISVLVFFIDPIHVDPRFGLSVGALFAAVGNKYIVDEFLPQTAAFTLVDKIHTLTYIMLLFCIVLSVISLRLAKNGRHQKRRKLDEISFWGLVLIYVGLNWFFIFSAA